MTTPHRKLKILVADDHKITADTLALILIQNGCEAVAVYCGEDAVKLSAELNPDVLISDVVMPGMNGIEAAILIGTALPRCEIVLVSGQHETEDLLHDAGLRGYVFEVLPKPVHPDAMLARLQQPRSTTNRHWSTSFPKNQA